MHTTASDGRLTPAELVARAAAAGLTTISVTDHDTVAALAEVTAAARPQGIRVVPGIEITAIDHGRDVHMLGYFFDPASAPLAALLESQRALRVMRVREIADTLASLGMPIDVESVLLAAAARPGSSVGRPQVARELVRAGHVASVQEAFDRVAGDRPSGLRAAHRPEPRGRGRHDSRGRRRGVDGASRRDQARRADRAAGRTRPRCDRGLSLRSHARGRQSHTEAWRRGSACSSPADRIFTATIPRSTPERRCQARRIARCSAR